MPVDRSPTAVVVAHPDDEALWLSSVVASASHVVFCFGAVFGRPRLSEARRRAVAALPLPGIIDLEIPESGCGFAIDPPDAAPTASGVEIADPAARARYESNYTQLSDALRTTLAGFAEVYTHNPWGEYGHPEHIQVHRAVSALQSELGYTIWFANYVGASSWPLARKLGSGVRWTERRTVRPDLATAHALMRVYYRCGAWTWSRAHCWPAREMLYALPPAGSARPRHPMSAEGLLDVRRLRWWSPLRAFACRPLSGSRSPRAGSSAERP